MPSDDQRPEDLRELVIKILDLILPHKSDWMKDENFVGTPSRVARMLLEMTEYTREGNFRVDQILEAQFPTVNDEIVVVTPIRSSSLCPHHLLPVHYDSSFAYIPEKKAVGISKIPRLVKYLSLQPILQEDLTTLVPKIFSEYLKPRGVFFMMRGVHSCMWARGVKEQGSVVTTSCVTGLFKEDASAKQEVLSLLR